MPAERYYSPQLFNIGQKIELSDQEYHHLIHVMRTKQGDKIELVNGKGQLASGTVESVSKKNAVLLIHSLFEAEPEPYQMTLAQGIPRLNRLEFIIEKGTELGMTEIWLFPTLKSEKKDFSSNQLERLQGLAISAMKQCGRLFLPSIILMPPLKDLKTLNFTTILFGDTNPEAIPFHILWETCQSTQAIFFIGPEGGFSEEELIILKKNHAVGVKLHPNILRTDTAALSALTLLSHQITYNKLL